MKRLSAVLLLLTLLTALFAVLPASADPVDPNNVVGCERLNQSNWDGYYHTGVLGGAHKEFYAGDRIRITTTASDMLYLQFDGQQVETSNTPLVYVVPADVVVSVIEFGTVTALNGNVTVKCLHEGEDEADGDDSDSPAGPPCYNALDGRINRSTVIDCSAPVAAYSGETLDIYAVSPQTGAGNMVFRVDPKALVAQTANQTLWQGVNPFDGQPLIVSLLSTGEVQVNAFYPDGKPYTIAWPADAPQNFYHIAW